jgi:hypothetical protein
MRPADDQIYYAELEAGARYLADGAGTIAEGDAHRANADLYARRRADAAAWER